MAQLLFLKGPETRKITCQHWKNGSRCFNESCRKEFSLRNRNHHCRRCGEVFCSTCIQYRRKLNWLAHFDPEGRLYKVCQACSEEGQNDEGATRNISEEFASLRDDSQQNEADSKQGKKTRSVAGGRTRLNIDRECDRIITGFRDDFARSTLLQTQQKLGIKVSRPDWQKSNIQLPQNKKTCQVCCETFSLRQKRRSCKVCSVVVCKFCSAKQLLVFIPDEQPPTSGESNNGNKLVKSGDLEPRLAITGHLACPEIEPKISLLLRVCSQCREFVEKRAEREDEEGQLKMLTELASLHDRFSAVESSFSLQLQKFQEIVESLEHSSPTAGGGTPDDGSQTNLRMLDKPQADMTVCLAQYQRLLEHLSLLDPGTNTQRRLLKNYMQAKRDFYWKSMPNFRKITTKLEESSASEKLEMTQRRMNKKSKLRDSSEKTFQIFRKMKTKLKGSSAPEMLESTQRRMNKNVRDQDVASGSETDWELVALVPETAWELVEDVLTQGNG